MATAITQIMMPFQPLVRQITHCLNFPKPTYTLLDPTDNIVYLTNRPDITYLYLGGQARLEDSCEQAAQVAVRDIMRRHKVSVEDVTSLIRRDFERCTFFYKLKCMQLERAQQGTIMNNKGKGVAHGESSVVVASHYVAIDFMMVFRAIFREIPVQGAPNETAQIGTNKFVALITITPPSKPNGLKCIFGESSSSVAGATQNLAQNIIVYLLSVYDLEVVDANYNPAQSRLAPVLCSLEREAYLSMKERVLGVKETQGPSLLLTEQDCITPKGATYHVPAPLAPPLPPKKKPYKRATAGSSVIPANKCPAPVFFSVPSELETVFKHSKFT